VPEQAEHEKVDRLLSLDTIGMELSGGYAPVPEQSTLALVAHHPQAGYFGMRNGRLLPDGSPDDIIKGTSRDPSLFGTPSDEDPEEDAVREEAQAPVPSR
jgi:5-methyltetrahydrofolate--homocysteine methyltransferase